MPDQKSDNQAPGPEQKESAGSCDCPWCSLKEHLNRWSESEAGRHFSKAHEEFLLGVRALIDSRLDEMGAKPNPDEPRVTKIKVE